MFADNGWRVRDMIWPLKIGFSGDLQGKKKNEFASKEKPTFAEKTEKDNLKRNRNHLPS